MLLSCQCAKFAVFRLHTEDESHSIRTVFISTHIHLRIREFRFTKQKIVNAMQNTSTFAPFSY